MKKLLAILTVVLFLALPVWAEDKDDPKPDKAKCPGTPMQSDCLTCHTLLGNKMVLKEFPPDAWRTYPTNVPMRVISDVGRFVLTDIDSRGISEFFAYLNRHGIKKAVIELHSPGGSLFDAQRIVNIIKEWQSGGGTVETRLYGMAFSAGFYIFVSGDHRLVSADSDLMWHELLSFEGFGLKLTTPSDSEQSAKILRHLQDVRNNYLVTRGKLTKAELDAKISRRQEWWMTGRDAVELGFADGFIGK